MDLASTEKEIHNLKIFKAFGSLDISDQNYKGKC